MGKIPSINKAVCNTESCYPRADASDAETNAAFQKFLAKYSTI